MTPPDDRREGDAVAKPKPKRVQGAGSIDTLPSGRQRLRFSYRGETITQVVDTPEEAEALRRALVQERAERAREAARKKEPEVETLATWGARWLQRRETTGAVRWSKDDQRRWQKHVEGSALAKMPLAELRTRDVRAWVDGMMAKRNGAGAPLRHQTIANAFNLVRKALGDAAADEVIPANPAALVKVPKRTAAGKTWDVLTAEEVEAVEGCEDIPEHHRLLFTFAVRSGLRAGELWALQWHDINLTGDPSVTVARSHGNAPKAGKVRTIPLLPAAVRALSRLEALARDADAYAPDALVFPSPGGGRRDRGDDARWSPESGGKGKPVRWPGYRAVAGITRRVRFHDLRHTTATHLLAGTWTATPWPITAVRDMLRHSSVTVTERYAHAQVAHLHALAKGAPTTLVTRPPPRDNPRDVQDPTGNVTNQSRPWDLNPRPAVYETARFPLEFKGNSAIHDRPVTDSTEGDGALADVALELLRAVDDGRPAGPLARGLAVEVLRRSAPDSAPWLRAVDVLEAGALRVRVAVELAGLVLDAVERAVDRAREEVG